MSTRVEHDLGPSVPTLMKSQLSLIIVLVFLFAALGGAIGWRRGSNFVAESLILLEESQPGAVFDSFGAGGGDDPEVFLNDQVAIITSTSLAMNVAETLGLEATPEVAEDLLDNLEVTPRENSHAIRLEFVDTDSAFAIETVNTFVSEYEMIASAALNGPYGEALTALDTLIAETQGSIDQLRADIDTETMAATSEAAAQIDAILARVDAIAAALPAATDAQRLLLVAELDALTVRLGSLERQVEDASTNPAIESMQGQLDALVQERAQLATRRTQIAVDQAATTSPIIARTLASSADTPPPGLLSGVFAGVLLGLIVGLGVAYWRSTSDDGENRY